MDCPNNYKSVEEIVEKFESTAEDSKVCAGCSHYTYEDGMIFCDLTSQNS